MNFNDVENKCAVRVKFKQFYGISIIRSKGNTGIPYRPCNKMSLDLGVVRFQITSISQNKTYSQVSQVTLKR